MSSAVAAVKKTAAAMAAIKPLFKAEHAAKAAKAAKNVENIAVVANVVVEKRWILSHLQQLVNVKLRTLNPNPFPVVTGQGGNTDIPMISI